MPNPGGGAPGNKGSGVSLSGTNTWTADQTFNANVGFYGTAPVAQASAIGAPTVDVTSNNTAIIAIRNALRTIGLIAT